MPANDQADYYSISRLRSNTLIFVGGKGINAALSLFIFALIASSLPKAEFVIYAWLIAFVELSNNLSRFGINWAVDRYVPELRSTLNTIALRRFILIMTGLRFGLILVMAIIFFWGGEALLLLSGKENWIPAFNRYIVIIIPFALMTFFGTSFFNHYCSRRIVRKYYGTSSGLSLRFIRRDAGIGQPHHRPCHLW